MSIVTVEPPVTTRTGGRRARLSDEDLKDLATAIEQGRWASDNESTNTRTAAYQRAQTAVKLLGERYELDSVKIKTSVYPRDTNQPDGPFLWAIGPRPADEKPRKKDGKGS